MLILWLIEGLFWIVLIPLSFFPDLPVVDVIESGALNLSASSFGNHVGVLTHWVALDHVAPAGAIVLAAFVVAGVVLILRRIIAILSWQKVRL